MAVPYITLADGRRISTSNGREVDDGATQLPGPEIRGPRPEAGAARTDPIAPSPPSNVSATSEPLSFEPAQRRSIADLPEEGKRANVVALAVALQLFGLSDDEIAMQMRADIAAVKGLLISKSAADFRTALVDSVSRRYEPAVRNVLNGASVDAARELVSQVKRGRPSDRLKAASSILDRTGHAAVNNVEHKVAGGLVIEVVQRGSRMPDVELEGV